MEQQAINAVYSPDPTLPILDQRERLPIHSHKLQLLYLLESKQVVIVVGQTGSGTRAFWFYFLGKTTQIPQYLHEAGWTQGGRQISCTQPRRIAATTIATRVAEEMGVLLGQEVRHLFFNE